MFKCKIFASDIKYKEMFSKKVPCFSLQQTVDGSKTVVSCNNSPNNSKQAKILKLETFTEIICSAGIIWCVSQPLDGDEVLVVGFAHEMYYDLKSQTSVKCKKICTTILK